MSDSILGGMPHFASNCHRALLGTESYAFRKSTNSINKAESCSLLFSTSCHAVKIMSAHPLPFLNPHCDSGRIFSATTCSLSCRILANTFPTTSSRLMPRQLSHSCRSPFLGMGTTSACFQSSTTSPSLHTVSITFSILLNSLSPPARSSSGRMPVCPPAFPLFIRLKACSSSSREGGSSSAGSGGSAGNSSTTDWEAALS